MFSVSPRVTPPRFALGLAALAAGGCALVLGPAASARGRAGPAPMRTLAAPCSPSRRGPAPTTRSRSQPERTHALPASDAEYAGRHDELPVTELLRVMVADDSVGFREGIAALLAS